VSLQRADAAAAAAAAAAATATANPASFAPLRMQPSDRLGALGARVHSPFRDLARGSRVRNSQSRFADGTISATWLALAAQVI